MKLKVGDKVQCVKDFYNNGVDGWKGLTGTVVAFSPKGSPGVDFKQQSSTGYGNNLGGRIETETGWWFTNDDIRHYLKKVSKQFEFSFK